MRKTFAAAALVAAMFGGIAAGTGVASADQPGTGTGKGLLGNVLNPVVGDLVHTLLGDGS